MPAINSEQNFLLCDMDRFPQLAESVLTRLGCKDFKYNKAYSQITAADSERYPGRNNWLIEYEILLGFARQDDGTKFDLTVKDSRNAWSKSFCEKRLQAIKEGLIADAQKPLEGPKTSTAYGASRWATDWDLGAAGYVCEHPDHRRLLLAPWGAESLAVPRELTNWHALICGPTGAGKSSGFFIPNLTWRTQTSAIVTEATAGSEPPELYLKTAGWRAAHGHQIFHFNPSDPTSTRINPIDSVLKAPDSMKTTVAETLADLIILNTTPIGAFRGDPIWDKNEKHLLTIFILHMAAKDPELAHFGAIRQLLTKNEKYLYGVLINSPSAFAAREFDSFCNHSSSNFRHGVFAGLNSRLNPWTAEPIIELTKTTDMDVEALKEELFTFYFSVPSRKAGMKPIAALTFNYLLDLALDAQFKEPLSLFLDEFTNFGYIPGIDDALSIIRRRSIPCVLGIQDYRQLESVYSREKAGIIMTQVGTRVFFRPRDFKTAKEVSEGLGQQTIVEQKFTDRGSVQEREFGRPLMTASEFMELDTDKVLILTPSTPPVVCTRFTHKSFPAPIDPPPVTQRPQPAVTPVFEQHEGDLNQGSVDAALRFEQLQNDEEENEDDPDIEDSESEALTSGNLEPELSQPEIAKEVVEDDELYLP